MSEEKKKSEKIEKKDEEQVTIKFKKETLWKASTFILAAILIVFVIFFFVNKNDTSTENVVQQPGNQVPAPGAKVQVSTDDDALIGSKNAKVTIVEFSDYQCPFCRKFWVETYPQLKKDYIDTGKANLVFRDFPLSFHPSAQISGEAAECVREKGGDAAYFKYHDKMFSEQNILDSGSANGAVSKTVTYGEAELVKWAKDLGYDIQSCLDSGKYTSEVQKDQAEGASYGVQGTPSFFVNGKMLEGAQPYSAFKAAIDAELQ